MVKSPVAEGSLQEFVSSYRTPEPNMPGSLVVHRWTGLIAPSTLSKLLTTAAGYFFYLFLFLMCIVKIVRNGSPSRRGVSRTLRLPNLITITFFSLVEITIRHLCCSTLAQTLHFRRRPTPPKSNGSPACRASRIGRGSIGP